MHFTIIVLLDLCICWVLPFYLTWTYAGMFTALVIAVPVIMCVSFCYMQYWRPSNWTGIRNNPNFTHKVYDTPLVVHGPGKDFDPRDAIHRDSKFVVGAHPHGLYPMGVTLYFTLNMRFWTFRTCVHWMLTTFPILKEFTGWAGCIDATREVMKDYIERSDVQGLVVCPGSAREGMIETPGTVVKRTGFISLAIQHKAYLIPAYDASTASMWDIWLPLGTYFHERLRYPWPVMAKGRWPPYLNPLPRYKTVHLYLGKPIKTAGREIGEVLDEFYHALAALKDMAKKDGNLSCDAEWK